MLSIQDRPISRQRGAARDRSSRAQETGLHGLGAAQAQHGQRASTFHTNARKFRTLRPWSCDTFVVQADASANGRLIFGKNSDRPAGEAQPLRMVPARKGGDRLDLAYVSIADEPAYAHLGSSPFWCWGYEFGINEHDVAIGNEAQFTRSWAEDVVAARTGNPPDAGIIGMELVRLGLERGSSAAGALDVMTRLLEQYGQWGSGAFGKDAVDGAYDNSYLIADRTDAWVLETSGREWVARRIASGTYSISNQPSIRSDFDRTSRTLLETARKRGWITSDRSFDYAASHVDPMTPLQVSHIRQRRSEELLQKGRAAGGVDLAHAKRVLRDHFEGTFLNGPYFNAARPDFHTLCMHEHPAGFTWGNTAASVVVEFGEHDGDLTVIWWTPLSPCIGAYIPIFLQSGGVPHTLQMPAPAQPVGRPEEYEQPAFDPGSYWWRFQNLLDAAKGDALGSAFPERQASIRARFDRLERGWSAEVDAVRRSWRSANNERRSHLVDELRAVTARAVEQVDEALTMFVLEFAPEARGGSVDPRWAQAQVG